MVIGAGVSQRGRNGPLADCVITVDVFDSSHVYIE